MKLFLILLLVCSSTLVHAQKQGQEFLDSLIAAIPFAKNDTQQVRLLNKVVLEGTKINPSAKLKQYAEMGLQLATKMKWDRAIAIFHNSYGDLYSNDEKGEEAIHEYEVALGIQKKIKDSFNICISQNNIGVVYQHSGNYTKAIDYFTQTVKLSQVFNNTYLLALGYSNIATVYTDQGNYKMALDYLQKSLALREKDEDIESVAATAQNMGEIYLRTKDSIKASIYYNRALHTFLQTENKEGLAQVYGSLAKFCKDSVQKKLNLLLKAQHIWDSTFPRHPNALTNLGALGETFLLLAKQQPLTIIAISNNTITGRTAFLQQALFYLQKGIALSKESNGINNYAALHKILAAVEEDQGDYENALLHFKIFYTLTDSIYSQENKNKIAGIESQKAIDLKDKEIALNKLAIDYQKKTQVGLIAGLCLLGIIGALLFWQNRTRKKTNTTLLQLNNELDEANKLKAKFFAILSHDFRGPVSRLVHFLHLQKEDAKLWTAEEAAVHEKKITTSAESLLENMEAMLTWSKGQIENFKPHIEAIKVNDLFAYLQKFFADTKNVDLSFVNVEEIIVQTDLNYLQTIMHNLTSNAIKALQNKPNGTIVWNAKQLAGKTVLSIADNGPGVNEEQTKALYKDVAITNAKTGLGLYLIKDLAKAIGCKISIQSQPSNGTIFILEL
jgi:tetratricopeptide (TPR) repeat protein